MTQIFLKVVQNNLSKNEEFLKGSVLNTISLKDVDLCVLSQCKGHIHTLRDILDMKNYITDEDIEGSHDRDGIRT